MNQHQKGTRGEGNAVRRHWVALSSVYCSNSLWMVEHPQLHLPLLSTLDFKYLFFSPIIYHATLHCEFKVKRSKALNDFLCKEHLDPSHAEPPKQLLSCPWYIGATPLTRLWYFSDKLLICLYWAEAGRQYPHQLCLKCAEWPIRFNNANWTVLIE